MHKLDTDRAMQQKDVEENALNLNFALCYQKVCAKATPICETWLTKMSPLFEHDTLEQ